MANDNNSCLFYFFIFYIYVYDKKELTPSHPEQKKGIIKTRLLLTELIEHLIQDCQYKAPHIFLFGFSQGGTVALNQVLQGPIRNLGGVVSIAGYEPFLSFSHIPSVKYDGPILILQGEKDPVVGSKANGEKMVSVYINKYLLLALCHYDVDEIFFSFLVFTN